MVALLYSLVVQDSSPFWCVGGGRESDTLILYSGLFLWCFNFVVFLWFKICMVDTFLD